jgi:hypothetical protein
MKTEALQQITNIFTISTIYTKFYLKLFNNFKQGRALKKIFDIKKNYSTSHTPNIQGIFIIMTFNILTEPKAIFLFYNPNTCKILAHKMHIGKSYYKGYTKFVTNTLKNIQSKQTSNVLVPKNYVNNSLCNYTKILLGVTLIPYTRKMNNSPKVFFELKNLIKQNKDLNKTSLHELVNKYNSSWSLNKVFQALSGRDQIIKRMYSTLNTISNTVNSESLKITHPYSEKSNKLNTKLPINVWIRKNYLNCNIPLPHPNNEFVYKKLCRGEDPTKLWGIIVNRGNSRDRLNLFASKLEAFKLNSNIEKNNYIFYLKNTPNTLIVITCTEAVDSFYKDIKDLLWRKKYNMISLWEFK